MPQQALFLMNSPFLAEQSRRLAGRPEVATPPEPEARIRRLYDLTLGRSPDPRELALGLAFLDAQAGAPAPPPESGWSHGFGAIDEAAGRVVEFRPLPHWSGSSWQLGPDLPHPEGGYLHLSAVGGHPGLDPRHSAIRRWIAPRDATIAVEGALGRESDRGDGVRGRVVSGRSGILATWTVHHGQIATPVARVEVRQGETIDFVLDCLGDDSFDTFTWAPSIRVLDGAPGRAAWSATADFSGPLPDPLNPLERFAQVLLMTNEFLYVD